MKELCISFGYSLESKDNWIFISSNKKYTTKVSFINKNIVHLDVIGSVDEYNLTEVWSKVEKLIQNKTNGSKYYLIHNYKDVKTATTKARNNYIHWIKDNLNNIHSVYFYNVSPYFRINV